MFILDTFEGCVGLKGKWFQYHEISHEIVHRNFIRTDVIKPVWNKRKAKQKTKKNKNKA